MIEKKHLPIERVTQGPKHHFFGYFDKFPWDRSGQRLLAQETPFTAWMPQPGEKATLGVITDGNFQPVAETDAWCWQQGCMFQWLCDSQNEIIYNDREEGSFVARILDLSTGEKRTLHRPVYCLSPDGQWALSLNFSRLNRERPGYGYPGAYDSTAKVKIPDNDGLFLVDLKNDTSQLIISIAQMTDLYYRSDMADSPGWFNHLLFSPDSRRIAFLHRWRLWVDKVVPSHLTHMFTASIDGSDIWPLNLENMSSHYTWVDDTHIINFSRRFKMGDQYYLYRDRSDKTKVIALDIFPGDGHCSFSPDGKWMLTDSYPLADQCRRLFLFELETEKAYEIGSFFSDPSYPHPTRCDLHPNWSRDGVNVCIDSIHEGTRQMYVIDVSPLTKES